MPTPEDAMLRRAQQAIRQGSHSEARHLLRTLLQRQPEHFTAWLLLASVTPNPRAALVYIDRAARLRPDSPTVAKARSWAQGRLAAGASAPAASPSSAPRTGATMSEPEAVVSAPDRQDKAATGASRRRLALAAVGVIAVVALLWGWRAWRIPATNAGAAAGVIADAANAEAAAVTATLSPTATAEAAVDVEASLAEPAPAVGPSQTPTPAPFIPAKQISQHKDGEAAAPRPTWTVTPTPTPTPSPTPTPIPTFLAPNAGGANRPVGIGAAERWIDVNLTTQTLVAYEGNVPVLNTLISSGTWQYPTVTGQFRIYLRYESQTMDGRRLGYDYYLENVPYVMYFYKDYALHGTFWHNNFGNPMSHGCVNMYTPDARWLFQWAGVGTLVNVHY